MGHIKFLNYVNKNDTPPIIDGFNYLMAVNAVCVVFSVSDAITRLPLLEAHTNYPDISTTQYFLLNAIPYLLSDLNK